MSDFIFELVERRSQNKTSEFVFPADSKTGYIYEPKKAVKTQWGRALSCVFQLCLAQGKTRPHTLIIAGKIAIQSVPFEP